MFENGRERRRAIRVGGTLVLHVEWPAPVRRGYNGRAWKMRPLRGWTGGQAADGDVQSNVGDGVPEVASSSPVNVRIGESMTDANPDPISPGQRYAQAQLAIPAFRFAAPYVARGLGALLGAGAGTLLLNEGQEQKPPEASETGPPSNVIIPRPDVAPQAGGRSGELVAGLKGPPNSAIPAAGPGHIFITDKTGEVVIDVTRKRAKFIRKEGKWGKRNPTP